MKIRKVFMSADIRFTMEGTKCLEALPLYNPDGRWSADKKVRASARSKLSRKDLAYIAKIESGLTS